MRTGGFLLINIKPEKIRVSLKCLSKIACISLAGRHRGIFAPLAIFLIFFRFPGMLGVAPVQPTRKMNCKKIKSVNRLFIFCSHVNVFFLGTFAPPIALIAILGQYRGSIFSFFRLNRLCFLFY